MTVVFGGDGGQHKFVYKTFYDFDFIVILLSHLQTSAIGYYTG